MIWRREKQVYVLKDHGYKETDSIYSVQSSLKYHSLWVTLTLTSKIFIKILLIVELINPPEYRMETRRERKLVLTK